MRRRALTLAVALLAGACAPEVVRTQIVPPSARSDKRHADAIVLARPATVRLGTGYSRTLDAGSRWRLAGAIPNGAVYQAAQGVFTIEGANIHEAYLVIRGRELVGFYLPVERAFSPLDGTVLLSLQDN